MSLSALISVLKTVQKRIRKEIFYLSMAELPRTLQDLEGS
jgi:hypothetical protein